MAPMSLDGRNFGPTPIALAAVAATVWLRGDFSRTHRAGEWIAPIGSSGDAPHHVTK